MTTSTITADHMPPLRNDSIFGCSCNALCIALTLPNKCTGVFMQIQKCQGMLIDAEISSDRFSVRYRSDCYTSCLFNLYSLASEQDSVGGPARLSYAQVAQHHKEKVERMLREKQSTEQEKEKDKDRKKEGSTTRVVQQHGDIRG
jgi:hypothetical protein